MLLTFPLLKDWGKLMIGHNDMLIYLVDAVYVVQHTSKDGAFAYLQQWLGEITSKFSKSRCIAGSNDNILHPLFNL